MDRVRALLFLSVCLMMTSSSWAEGQRSEVSALPPAGDDWSLRLSSRDMAEALQSFLDASDRVGLSVEKKASVIPRCDVGERCAMKHGPRIGRLCDCLRGTACNTFFLRCY